MLSITQLSNGEYEVRFGMTGAVVYKGSDPDAMRDAIVDALREMRENL